MVQCSVCGKRCPTEASLPTANGLVVCRNVDCAKEATIQTNPKSHTCHHCHKPLGEVIPFAVQGLHFCGLACSIPYVR